MVLTSFIRTDAIARVFFFLRWSVVDCVYLIKTKRPERSRTSDVGDAGMGRRDEGGRARGFGLGARPRKEVDERRHDDGIHVGHASHVRDSRDSPDSRA